MSQALYTTMGGISAAQAQINVVSNNIANINTIGFKESNVTFQDIFSTTLTGGNSPTVTTGGKNPVQIGLGVQVGTISKNMDSGTWTATGKATDMMIQGNGFFTVRSSSGQIFLTKAGNFTFDANGDMVNAQGYKVVGANQLYTASSSSSTVKVPQQIVSAVTANNAMASKSLSDLNDCQITTGNIFINVNTSAVSETVPVALDATDNTIQKICDKIQNAIDAKMGWTAATRGVTIKCDASTGGKIKFELNQAIAPPNRVNNLDFGPGTTNPSNFFEQIELSSLNPDTHEYTSKILDYQVDVSPVTSTTAAIAIKNYSIAGDGSIEATYSNGDKVTIELNTADNTFRFKYTTSTGITIRKDDVHVNPNVAQPPNFQIQLANVINPEGLVSEGGNLWSMGANSGTPIYTVGGAMGVGAIKSGGLEASNVDMSKQFSNMIMAQRAIQANSRVFGVTSDIMQTLVMLGR